ncbi:hypothetical protein DICVIV_06443 [Dictyocaulus viviparus]|uniref:Uncharacterized protein n=1 Tax=Dictyocaulus viviparus TaxID=29172 RepID=A0A0D8XYL9_DICVI|nr:hypothetical protein DICVIV_06443 [Dictyocaulus viviparus]
MTLGCTATLIDTYTLHIKDLSSSESVFQSKTAVTANYRTLNVNDESNPNSSKFGTLHPGLFIHCSVACPIDSLLYPHHRPPPPPPHCTHSSLKPTTAVVFFCAHKHPWLDDVTEFFSTAIQYEAIKRGYQAKKKDNND